MEPFNTLGCRSIKSRRVRRPRRPAPGKESLVVLDKRVAFRNGMNKRVLIGFRRVCELGLCTTLLLATPSAARARAVSLRGVTAAASSSASGFGASGAIDTDRFSPVQAWQGAAAGSNWWWQVRFDPPREIGAILQITGDHPFVLRNAPRDYAWQWSDDGERWTNLLTVTGEQRTFRVHRFATARRIACLRLQITGIHGRLPTLREVEFYSSPADQISFPDWIVAVNTTDKPDLPGEGRQFIPLARSCPGWERLQAQQIWVDSLDKSFVEPEPKPLCAFLSGNFKDW